MMGAHILEEIGLCVEYSLEHLAYIITQKYNTTTVRLAQTLELRHGGVYLPVLTMVTKETGCVWS